MHVYRAQRSSRRISSQRTGRSPTCPLSPGKPPPAREATVRRSSATAASCSSIAGLGSESALAQDLVDAVSAPDAEQAPDAAPADVDQVLGEQMAAWLARRPQAPKQRQVGRQTSVRAEGAVKAHDVVVGVAARLGKEADPGVRLAGEPEHELVEQRIAGLHRESPTAEGDDLSLRRHSSSNWSLDGGVSVMRGTADVPIRGSTTSRAELDTASNWRRRASPRLVGQATLPLSSGGGSSIPHCVMPRSIRSITVWITLTLA